MPNITREDREQFSVTNCFLSNRAQMKTDKDVLAHAILLTVMGRLNVARINIDRDNSQRARLRRAKEKPIVEALRIATDAPTWASDRNDRGNPVWTSSFTSDNRLK